MKHYEELSRFHANEAIQRGLEAQQIHRALSGSREEQFHPNQFVVGNRLVNLMKKSSQLMTLFNKMYQDVTLTSTRGRLFYQKSVRLINQFVKGA